MASPLSVSQVSLRYFTGLLVLVVRLAVGLFEKISQCTIRRLGSVSLEPSSPDSTAETLISPFFRHWFPPLSCQALLHSDSAASFLLADVGA